VPWRFSDARHGCVWPDRPRRRPRTCTANLHSSRC
jgi:hypothetical protein